MTCPVYRGFELVAWVCSHPPQSAGECGVCIHDDTGSLIDVATMDEAKAWIDARCNQADWMLRRVTWTK